MKNVVFEDRSEKLNVMPIEEIITKVSAACKKCGADAFTELKNTVTKYYDGSLPSIDEF